MRELKGGPVAEEVIEPELNVQLSSFLPETFIPDTDQRLIAYKRLATIAEESEIDELAKEWRDRYGQFPESVRSLILLAKTRLLARRAGLMRVDQDGESFVFTFAITTAALSLASYLEQIHCAFRLEAERKLRVDIWGRDALQRLVRLKRILQESWEHASDIKSIQ